ncbi:MAG: PAS domain S-box protein [Chloroflexi bacterium]|nr:PAS domain S-box protein [Chloroflexota bacterium]
MEWLSLRPAHGTMDNAAGEEKRTAMDEQRTREELIAELAQLRRRITELEASNEEIGQRETILRFAVEASGDGVWQNTLGHRNDFFSEGMFTMLGYQPVDPSKGVAFFRTLLHPDDVVRLEEAERALSLGENEYTVEFRLRAKDGHWRHILSRGRCLARDAQGRPTRVVGTHVDITKLKKTEAALRRSEALFRNLTETIPAAIFIYQGECIRYANREAKRLVGYTQEEFQNMRFWDIVHKDFRALVRERGLARQRGEPVPARYELKIVTKGGEERWLDLSAQRIEFEGAPAGLAIGYDITERKHAEQAEKQKGEALRRHVERLSFQREIDQAILAARSPSQVAQAVVGHIRRFVPCQRLSIIELISGEEGRVLAVDTEGETGLKAGVRISDLAQQIECLRESPVYLVEDTFAVPDFSPTLRALRAEGIRSFVNIPLNARGELVGFLNFGSKRPRSFSSEHIDVAREVAAPLAIAMQNARLAEAERRRSAELARSNAFLTALQQVAIRLQTTLEPEQVMATLGSELLRLGIFCFVVLLDAETSTLNLIYTSANPEAIALGKRMGLSERISLASLREHLPGSEELIERHRALFISDTMPVAAAILDEIPYPEVLHIVQLAGVTAEARSICLPLIIEGRLAGVLGMWGEDLREDDLTAASLFANQVAVAIENARLLETIRHHEQGLHVLSARLLDAQEAERQRISRELHDEMGQALTAMSIDLGRLEKKLPAHPDPEVGSLLKESRDVADQLLSRVRELSLALRPLMLDDLGLVPALRWHLNRYTERLGIPIDLEVSALPEIRLPHRVEIALYRIVQEALTNIARHAQASQVTVQLTYRADRVTLRIEDDGQGFDLHQVASREPWARGTGLLNIEERVSCLGGRFSILSHPGGGTRLVVEIPLDIEG